nr:hypothetical protein [Tanacetum cinerariifolium]
MRIPSWMITNEMKLTKNYQMYAEAFRVDVPVTQSQPIESTQGMHKTTSATRSPNPNVDEGESSAQRKFIVIRLHISTRRSTRLTPPIPIQNINEVEDVTLQDTIQLRIAEQKSRDDFEARENVEKFNEHLMQMKENLQLQHDELPIWLALKIKFEGLTTTNTPCRFSAIRPRDQDDHHDDAYPKGENSAKRKSIEEVYSNSKIVQVIKTTNELAHEHKFTSEIIARTENGSIVSITDPDYNNLNKNDIEDMYLLCINSKNVNLTATIITFSDIEKKNKFYIVFELIYGIIYKNNKKEKRVMRHQEIHKFCDATLKRVLEGLKSYNNDAKHGYVTPSLSKEDTEHIRLFEEEIEEQLKHHDQMRH